MRSTTLTAAETTSRTAPNRVIVAATITTDRAEAPGGDRASAPGGIGNARTRSAGAGTRGRRMELFRPPDSGVGPRRIALTGARRNRSGAGAALGVMPRRGRGVHL